MNRHHNRKKKVYSREWEKLTKLLGVVPIPGSPIITKKMRQILKNSPTHIINSEEGKWKWQVNIPYDGTDSDRSSNR